MGDWYKRVERDAWRLVEELARRFYLEERRPLGSLGPLHKRPGVYGIGGRLSHPDYAGVPENHYLYIGETVDLQARERQRVKRIRTVGLDVSGFWIVALPTPEVMHKALELHLIGKCEPPWNAAGFGCNDVGGPREAGRLPSWHALHQGEKWAEEMLKALTDEEIEARADELRVRLRDIANSPLDMFAARCPRCGERVNLEHRRVCICGLEIRESAADQDRDLGYGPVGELFCR